jgi:CheY-like chemotaxis protein
VHVDLAASAGEALHLINRQPFDILIADIGMPEQDGYSLVRTLREMRGAQRGAMPAIAVTAYASARERELALEAGYDWHLPKPVDPDELAAAVAAATGPGRRQQGRRGPAKRARQGAAKRPRTDRKSSGRG